MGIEVQPVLKNQGLTGNYSTSINVIPDVTAPVLVSSVPYSSTVNSTVNQLCFTQWDQVYPWNQYSPSSSSLSATPYAGHDPAGCTEIAMAQIMYFWSFPSTYNWPVMVKAIISTDASTTPVGNPGGFTGSAQLISDIGTTPGTFWTTALHTFKTGTFAYYQPSATTSDDEYAATVFNHFGYSSATTSQDIASQLASPDNGTYYETLIRNEIQNNRRPCMVGGYYNEVSNGLFYAPTGSGHDWVCDGSNYTTYTTGTLNTYKSFYGVITTQLVNITVSYTSWLHMNWGWGYTYAPNINTAWYNALTDYSAAPNGDDFKYFQIITYNIHP